MKKKGHADLEERTDGDEEKESHKLGSVMKEERLGMLMHWIVRQILFVLGQPSLHSKCQDS